MDPLRLYGAEGASIGGTGSQRRLIDIHCEATPKMAVGHFAMVAPASLSAHDPSNAIGHDDPAVWRHGMFQSDGMCGDYTVIGTGQGRTASFHHRMPKRRLNLPNGEATLSGIYVETDDRTGSFAR
jgi:calcineurin-like phosphoesterase